MLSTSRLNGLISILKKNKFFKNASWIIFQKIYTMLFSFIVNAVSARYLGPSNYGVIGYAASYISLFASIGTLGFEMILVNELVTNPEKNGQTLGTCFGVRFFFSFFGYIGAILLAVVLNPNKKILWVVVALQGISLLFQMHEVFGEWFNCQLLSKYNVFAYGTGVLISSVFKIILLVKQSSVIWFAFATACQTIVICIVVIFFYARKSNFKLSFSIKHAKYLLSKSHHYIVANLAIIIYSQMDRLMIGKMLNEYEVGIYSVASSIATLWEFIPMALINSSKPLIMEKRKTDYKEYMHKLETLQGITFGMSILVVFVMMLVGKWFIRIVYGEEYDTANVSLIILSCSTICAMYGCVRSIWFVAEDYNKYGKYCTVIGAIVNMILNYILIPCMGIEGAALSTFISMFGVCFVFPVFWRDTRKYYSVFGNSIVNLKHNIMMSIKNVK